MNEQWPSECHAEKRETYVDSPFKTEQDFRVLLDVIPNGETKDFENVVTWIVEEDHTFAELELQVDKVINAPDLQIPDSRPMMMTLACAAALAHTPSLQTWKRVNVFKCNSWQLEGYLDEAMMAYVKFNSSACNAYVKLAKAVFVGLEDFTLQSHLESTNKERLNVWTYWVKQEDKLDEIWSGLRGADSLMLYREEWLLFKVFYKLNPEEFAYTISESSNPYLLNALLFVADIGSQSPRFSEWKRMLAIAPVAFERSGKWNGAVLMPMLLVEARDQLLRTPKPPAFPEPKKDELVKAKQEIADTAKAIVTALLERQDATGALVRWLPWLMQQALKSTGKEMADVRFAGFADDALIDVIGGELGENSLLPKTSPNDAPAWEAWCYRCVLASLAHSGYIPPLDWGDFMSEWDLSPEDWTGTKGRFLREHASLIIALNREVPGVAANLLAYPMTQLPCSVKAWIGLWNRAITMREIVGYGDFDASEDEYSSRLDAGRLLLLLFHIGLAIFDQGAASSSDLRSSKAKSLTYLFKTLYSAAREMREIDNTLNHKQWALITQHLAVRRILWGQPSSKYQVFKVEDTPAIPEVLGDIKGDVVELIGVLQSLLLNHPDIPSLKASLKTASIELPDIVSTVRRMNQDLPDKYPMDKYQLTVLEKKLVN